MASLVRHAHVQVLHGHLHKTVDRLIGIGKSDRARELRLAHPFMPSFATR